MTVSELTKYFSDRTFFKDPDQEVEFVLSPDDIPLEKGRMLELRGSVGPPEGTVTVALQPVKTHRYRFSLIFEANPVIKAESVEEAKEKAREMMRGVGVTRQATSGVFEDMPEYEAREPDFLNLIS